MLCAVKTCYGDAVYPPGAFCADHAGQSIDPTVHALAVLGARYLRSLVDNNTAANDAMRESEDAALTVTGGYATPQIAATVARLTGGPDA